jgi:hypothetical protein
LRMRSAPPDLSAQISVNSFDWPAFVPGLAGAAFCVSASLVSFVISVVGIALNSRILCLVTSRI